MRTTAPPFGSFPVLHKNENGQPQKDQTKQDDSRAERPAGPAQRRIVPTAEIPADAPGYHQQTHRQYEPHRPTSGSLQDSGGTAAARRRPAPARLPPLLYRKSRPDDNRRRFDIAPRRRYIDHYRNRNHNRNRHNRNPKPPGGTGNYAPL